MAVDRKSDHVGNHGGTYVDDYGHTKQFTYVDHDKKTKIAVSKSAEPLDSQHSLKYREELLTRILDLPASICDFLFQDFTIRGEGSSVIKWNEKMLRDVGVPVSQLKDLCILLENKADTIKLTP